MTISRQNLTIIIVTYKSEDVIHDCIKSIPSDINILIVDNSGDQEFKQRIENKYSNVSCILSTKNLGMGSGNNLGLRNVKSDYALILNPDVILEEKTIDELISASKQIKEYSIIAPISKDENYPNYKSSNDSSDNSDDEKPFKVNSIDGYAMLFNLNKINKLKGFENFNYFDENIFLYLENDDLCKRLIDLNENIYIAPKSKINHLGASGTSKKYSYQVEISRNWHWMWSKFYFKRKHYGYLNALISGFPKFLSSILKFLFYTVFRKQNKREIYFNRASGYLNALLGNKSTYRPKLD